MTDLAPGDVIEIALPDGPAHLQLTHEHPSYPPVVRVICRGPGDSAEAAAARATAFRVMIPLGTALARAGVEHRRLGPAPIPEADRTFPTFRTPIRDKAGAVIYWWLWDGRSLSVAAGEAETEGLPLREITSARALLDRIAREA